MGFLDLMKKTSRDGVLMAQAKEAEKFQKIKERDDKIKIAKYNEEGIVYCPKCLAINLKSSKKKYRVERTENGTVLTDFDGNILGPVTSKDIELICGGCGYKWRSKTMK